MPVVGAFHNRYWKARANAPPPPATPGVGGYPAWQASVICSVVWGVPFDIIKAWYVWARLVWTWGQRIVTLPPDQIAVIERVVQALTGPQWADVRQRVRACANTPGFHDPKAWIDYSRALRANPGQAQNLYRHLKVVSELQAVYPALSNPGAHLLAELGYQQFAAEGRPRRVDAHPILN